MEIASKVVKCHPGLWGTIFGTFGEKRSGFKIAVDGYCFGQRLSTAIFHFKPYKTTKNERENERKLNICLLVLVKNPSFSNPNFPESTGPRATGS